MAKVNSLITLRGTIAGLTFVNSATYGEHVRAARGTYKKAQLNEAFKKQSKKLVKSNVPAKIIKDAIDPYRKDFYDGSLWPRLVSMTNELFGDDGSFDLAKLKPFEIHAGYPLHRLLSLQTNTKVDRKGSKLQVGLSYDMHPAFQKSLPVDGYRLGVIAIYPDLKKQTAKTEIVYSKVIALIQKVAPLTLQVPIPPRAKTFLVCVRIDGCKKGVVYDTLASKGMRVVGGWEV